MKNNKKAKYKKYKQMNRNKKWYLMNKMSLDYICL